MRMQQVSLASLVDNRPRTRSSSVARREVQMKLVTKSSLFTSTLKSTLSPQPSLYSRNRLAPLSAKEVLLWMSCAKIQERRLTFLRIAILTSSK